MTAKPITHALKAVDAPALSRIAQLNDTFRRTGRGGVMFATAGVIALAPDALPAVLALVRAFDAFTPDTDPHGEHDFGVVEIGGERVFWKVDYYDAEQRYASPDPSDPSVTTRVLTVMLATEY